MTIIHLRYADDDFAIRAGKLVSNGQTFVVDVDGVARTQLEMFVQNGRIRDPARLGLKPKLQPLLAVLMLAEAREQAVSVDVHDEVLQILVGVGAA